MEDSKKSKSPKRVGHLFEKIITEENCRAAIREAAKNKRKKRKVKRVLNDLDNRTKKLKSIIETLSYRPSPYKIRMVNDGIKEKKRRTAEPEFWPDQCVHHALMRVILPVLNRGQYKYCIGSVKGKGDELGKKAIEKFIKFNPKWCKYVSKTDIHHYYPSTLHSEMKKDCRKKIKDWKVIHLLDLIIDSYREEDNQDTEERGAPIGNYPSPTLCNLYLEADDHFIKQYLGKKYLMVRMVDDRVIIGPNKRKLHRLHKILTEKYGNKGLSFKQNYQIYKFDSRDIDFMGFRFYKDGHTEIRRNISLRIRRKAKKISELQHINFKNAAGMMSYTGYIKRTNSRGFYKKYIKQKIKIRVLKEVISNETKLRVGKTGGNKLGNTSERNRRHVHRTFQREHS